MENLDRTPTCVSPRMKQQIGALQAIFKSNPGAARALKDAVQKEPLSTFYHLDHMKEFTKNSIEELNEFFQGYRILCVCGRIDSVKIWDLYAENHKGIALRILPNEEKDSKFKLFRKVEHRERMPCLYDSG